MEPTTASPDAPVARNPAGHGTGGGRRAGEVVLGMDARDAVAGAVDFAFHCARARGVRLRVVHAWALPASAAEWPFAVPERDRATWEDHEVQVLADALRPWRERYPDVRVLEDVVLLSPVQALTHHASGAGIVVVGSEPGARSRATVRALLDEAVCPVAVVPADSRT
ncbi:universal stress protein [Streptomyces neyagawaensis]|uniref:universal stress protein n=1 Tax=Streptomyces neyagawaensis TaxID=42238 RepID=UPI00099EE096|nr:universal stress protein [Streptomyces neyagawaensis]MCL6735971.1 universal stress protein [Streptomyces neyagawaensis]MDE1686889.1 universal stress protein [Streptomyces neyagawaensis]